MKLFRFTLMAVTATLLAGCQVPPVTEGPAPGIRVLDDRAPNARLNLDTVVILDKSLQTGKVGKLAVERSLGRRTATQTLEVIAVIRNRTDYPQQIEGRTQFYDAAGVPIEGPTAWQRLILDPQSINTYREFSTRTADVAHYYVEIREAR